MVLPILGTREDNMGECTKGGFRCFANRRLYKKRPAQMRDEPCFFVSLRLNLK